MNFDQRLKASQTQQQYHDNKVKAGRSGSSAGKPRPYARAIMRNARLYSPQIVGQSITVTPKHAFLRFRPGNYYEWKVVEPTLGYIDGIMLEAEEIAKHFIIKPKGKK